VYVVAVTGEPVQRNEVLANGFGELLMKPVHFSVIEEILSNLTETGADIARVLLAWSIPNERPLLAESGHSTSGSTNRSEQLQFGL